MNPRADDVLTGWDKAIISGRLAVYDVLAELAEAGHGKLLTEFTRSVCS